MTNYYITGRRADVYHTDPDCRHVTNRDLQEITEAEAERRFIDLCETCKRGDHPAHRQPGGLSKLERILQDHDTEVPADD